MCPTLLENRNNHFQVKSTIANFGRILFRDFDETFNLVFGRKAKIRGKILRELVDSPKTVAEVASMECSTVSGAYSGTLDDLCKAGYVMRDDGLNPLTCKKIKRARFRVSDNYVRFLSSLH